MQEGCATIEQDPDRLSRKEPDEVSQEQVRGPV